jgi:hypothetical protein
MSAMCRHGTEFCVSLCVLLKSFSKTRSFVHGRSQHSCSPINHHIVVKTRYGFLVSRRAIRATSRQEPRRQSQPSLRVFDRGRVTPIAANLRLARVFHRGRVNPITIHRPGPVRFLSSLSHDGPGRVRAREVARLTGELLRAQGALCQSRTDTGFTVGWARSRGTALAPVPHLPATASCDDIRQSVSATRHQRPLQEYVRLGLLSEEERTMLSTAPGCGRL